MRVRRCDLKLVNDLLCKFFGVLSVKEERDALSVRAEHHVVGDIHVADKPHAQSVFGDKRESHAKLSDLNGSLGAQVNFFVIF